MTSCINKNYPFLHWVTTLLLGSCFYFVWTLYTETAKQVLNDTGTYILIFLFSIIFSLPSLVLYFITFTLFERSKLPAIYLKLLLLLIGSGFIALTLFFIGGTMMTDIFIFFELAFIISAFITNIEVMKSAPPFIQKIEE